MCIYAWFGILGHASSRRDVPVWRPWCGHCHASFEWVQIPEPRCQIIGWWTWRQTKAWSPEPQQGFWSSIPTSQGSQGRTWFSDDLCDYIFCHILNILFFFKFNRRHRLPTGLLALPCLVVQFQRPLCSYDMFLFMSYSIFMWYHLLLLDPGREGEERSQSQAQTLVRGQSDTWWGSQASGASMAPQRVEAAGSLRNGHGISRLWIR